MRRTAADVGVEVVVPALAALLADAALEVRRDERPLLQDEHEDRREVSPSCRTIQHSESDTNRRRRGWHLRAVSRNELYDFAVLLRPPVALDHLRVKHLAPAVQTLDRGFVLEVRRNRLSIPRSAAIVPPICTLAELEARDVAS